MHEFVLDSECKEQVKWSEQLDFGTAGWILLIGSVLVLSCWLKVIRIVGR